MPFNPLAALSPFRRDSRANFAVTTALCAVPLIGMTGLAIDYGILLSNKAKLDAAADAGAIAAVTKARSVLMSGGLLTDALAQGKQQGQSAFLANAGRVVYSTQGAVTPTVLFQPTLGQSLTVNVSYTMSSSSQFGKLFNVGNYNISGSTSSNTVLMPYYQFIFVVDISNSMAVGGTSNDITGLINDKNITAASGQQCAFACHKPSGANPRAIAQNDGWKLKIDYLNSALQTFISTLDSNTTSSSVAQKGKVNGYFSVGIDTFGSTFSVAQKPVYPPSQAMQAAKSVDVEAASFANNGFTATTDGLNAALQNISNVGDGSSASSQATYVIFISDGVEDLNCWGCSNWNRYTDLSYTSACNTIKQKGITLISIEAAYPSIPITKGDDGQYTALVAPLQPPATSSMQSAMQACATNTSWYYRADDGPGINSAVNGVLGKVMQGLTRLTF